MCCGVCIQMFTPCEHETTRAHVSVKFVKTSVRVRTIKERTFRWEKEPPDCLLFSDVFFILVSLSHWGIQSSHGLQC